MIDCEYERGIVAKLMLQSSSFQECDLSAGEFSNEQYATVYQAISDMHAAGDVVDTVTVADYLYTQTDQNWLQLLADVVGNTILPADVGAYCELVRTKNRCRKAAEIGQELVDRAMSKSAVDNAIRDLMALSVPTQSHEYTMNNALKIGVEYIDAVKNGGCQGIRTGFTDLDTKLGGLHGGDLIVIGARPSMGKTAFMLNIALNGLDDDISTGIFSGEQDVNQLSQRMLAIRGSVPIMRLRNGGLLENEWPKLSTAVSHLKDKPMMIDDMPSPSLERIARMARKWKHTHNIGVVMVDYLQRMATDSRLRRHEAVGENVRGLKNLARELDIPVVVLAQVSRDVEKRPDKRPHMGDLSDSSEIEKEADQVFLLYRDEIYNEESPDKGICEIIVDKNRHGATGFVRVVWRGEYLQFGDLSYRAEAAR